jgi:hypothetical protein
LLILMGLLLAPVLVTPITKIFSRMIAMFFAREGRANWRKAASPGNRRAHVTASATMIGWR